MRKGRPEGQNALWRSRRGERQSAHEDPLRELDLEAIVS